MSHLALARKWRPQKFEDVIGQRGTVVTLRNAIESGRLAQSFIFAGPRGVGKTTTARILARALNCVKGPTADPCGKCDACREIAEGRDVDVLEIDGATYTGVDAVREVIVEPLSIAPMRDRYKIFIIDEVHRLSKNAFDALLKSIEEPPPYVKFMMATTDLHSVPATIQSRSQIFELKALPFAAIRDQLKAVTTKEKVAIEDAALSLVARAAEGSMRDALSALDQVLAFSDAKVTAADVSQVLGIIGRDSQFEIAEIVAREDAAAAFEAAARVVEAGFDLRIVCRELARLVRDLMVVKIDRARLEDAEIAAETERERLAALADQFSREDLMRAFDLLARAEGEVRRSSQPRHQFEMSLVEWIHLRKLTPIEDVIAQLDSGTPRPLAAGPSRTVSAGPSRPSSAGPSRPLSSGPSRVSPEGPSRSSSVGPSGSSPEGPSGPSSPGPSPDLKSRVLSSIREANKVFYGMVVAQAQRIDVDRDTLTFTFAPAHKTLRAQLEAKRGWIEQLAQAAAGQRMTVQAKDGEPTAPAASATKAGDPAKAANLKARAKAEPAVQAMLDVLGGDIESVEEVE